MRKNKKGKNLCFFSPFYERTTRAIGLIFLPFMIQPFQHWLSRRVRNSAVPNRAAIPGIFSRLRRLQLTNYGFLTVRDPNRTKYRACFRGYDLRQLQLTS